MDGIVAWIGLALTYLIMFAYCGRNGEDKISWEVLEKRKGAANE